MNKFFYVFLCGIIGFVIIYGITLYLGSYNKVPDKQEVEYEYDIKLYSQSQVEEFKNIQLSVFQSSDYNITFSYDGVEYNWRGDYLLSKSKVNK